MKWETKINFAWTNALCTPLSIIRDSIKSC